MRQLLKFLDLSAAQQRRALHAALRVVAFRVGLWVVPYRLLREMVDRVPRRRRQEGDAASAETITRYISSISQFVPSASCLTQALAAQTLLRREGFDPVLQFGVARDGQGVFKAHAWVECEGRIVIGEYSHMLPYVQLQPV